MFEVTEQARAEVEKRRKRARDAQDAATPGHALAEGHQEHLQEERERREQATKVNRHPESGQFVADPQRPYLGAESGHAADSPGNAAPTPRPVTSWPGTAAHNATDQGVRFTQVGDRHAASPVPHSTIETAQAARVSGPSFATGAATVQHLDFTSGSPMRPATAPTRPGFHTTPNTAGDN